MNNTKKKVFWIASYPKSGNTWIRAILSSLFFTEDGIFNFSLLKYILDFDIRERYEFVKRTNPQDFKKLSELKVISKYRISAQQMAKVGGDFAFYKTHSANIGSDGHDFTNNSTTFGLIYIVRDPRDVAISFSKHIGKPINETIEIMSKKNALTYTRSQYPVLMSKWDYHYLSWESLKVPKLVIKYENLLNDTKIVLTEIINFFKSNFNVNLKNENIKFNNIIKSTDFKNLQKYEKKFGFSEAAKSIFFRRGESAQWKKELTNEQINKIEKLFKKNMISLDYL